MKFFQSMSLCFALVTIQLGAMHGQAGQKLPDAEHEPVQLPSSQTLRAYLAQLPDLEHYLARDYILQELGGKKMIPIEVASIVGVSLLGYSVQMQRRKGEIVRALLKDSPEAIARLEKEHLI